MITKAYELPVDCILAIDEEIAICSYSLCNGIRKGKIQIIDPTDMMVRKEVSTSGTLDAIYSDGILYTANSQDITSYSNLKIKKQLKTEAINTYIHRDDNIYVANTNGEILVLDYELTLLNKINITKNPIWIIKKFENYLFFGDEAGFCYRYDLENNICCCFGDQRDGIIYIFFENDNVIISSYDSQIYIFNVFTLELNEIKKNVGALWRIHKYENHFYCSAIYDGLKIFDQKFNLIRSYKTESICYAIFLNLNKIFFSSFYDCKVFLAEKEEFI